MRRILSVVSLTLFAVALATPSILGWPDDPKAVPKADAKAAPKDKDAPKVTEGPIKFRVQEIDNQLRVGYAVIVADINGDGKPDIVVADTDRIVWYENPTWKRRTIIENIRNSEGAVVEKKIEPDCVSIVATDVDGDGKVDIILAAGWTGRFDDRKPGTLQWLRRGKSLDEPWEMHPIPCDEPTIHRIKMADLYADGKPVLVVAPLMGQNSNRTNNWIDGRPVKILAYKIPADPVKGPWQSEVINENLHVVHGIAPVPLVAPQKGAAVLAACYEGAFLVGRDNGRWVAGKLADGNQKNTLGARGCSEAKIGMLPGTKFLATIEPWHGSEVVVYTPGKDSSKPWDPKTIDAKLRWGHAVWCADLDGDGGDEIIVGVRDDPSRGDSFTERRGVRVYKSRDINGRVWDRISVDEGEIAVEDLTVADLDGDGRPDIIAVGRQTGNVRIYWNQK
jgi:FG-GAP-like repeat